MYDIIHIRNSVLCKILSVPHNILYYNIALGSIISMSSPFK